MKRFFLTGLFLAVLAGTIWAAISVDTPGTQAFNEGISDTTHTSTSFTVASQSNQLLIDGFGYNGPLSVVINYVRWGGVDLTLLREVSSGSLATTAVYYKIAPTPATSTLEVNLNNSNYLGQTSISLYGVNPSTPFRDDDAEAGTTATSTTDLTLTTVAGDWVGSCMLLRRNSGVDPGVMVPDNGTEIEQFEVINGLRFSCSYRTAAGATTTVGWSGWTASDDWSHVAFAVAPASAGSPIQFYRKRRTP